VLEIGQKKPTRVKRGLPQPGRPQVDQEGVRKKKVHDDHILSERELFGKEEEEPDEEGEIEKTGKKERGTPSNKNLSQEKPQRGRIEKEARREKKKPLGKKRYQLREGKSKRVSIVFNEERHLRELRTQRKSRGAERKRSITREKRTCIKDRMDRLSEREKKRYWGRGNRLLLETEKSSGKEKKREIVRGEILKKGRSPSQHKG